MKLAKKIPINIENRLLFQNKTPEKSSVESFNTKEKQNLNNVREVVKESYSQRLEMMRDIDQKINPIKAELDIFQKKVEEARKKLAESKGDKTQIEFTIMGEKIIIKIESNGSYQEYHNNEPINFIEWAISKKAKDVQ